LIDAANLSCARSYAFRFKGLVAALEATGVSGSGLTCDVISRFSIRCIKKNLVGAMLHCAVSAKATIKWMTCRTFRINGVMVRLLCTRCRYERSHACWHVALRYTPAIDFILWVRMGQANKQFAQIYLLPVSAFPAHRHLWPSILSLGRYEQYAHASIEHVFGLR
jgi:hypothetical protein